MSAIDRPRDPEEPGVPPGVDPTRQVAVGSSLLEVRLLDRLAAGEDVPDAQLDANDTRQGVIGLAQFALYVACIVTFISWLHLAYKNMEAFSPPFRRFGAGWAIGSWSCQSSTSGAPSRSSTTCGAAARPPRTRRPGSCCGGSGSS